MEAKSRQAVKSGKITIVSKSPGVVSELLHETITMWEI